MTDKKTILYGRKPILEALKEGHRFEKLLMQKGAEGNELQQIKSAAARQKLSIQFVPKEKLDYLSRPLSKGKVANHQGVLGFSSLVDYCTIDDLLHRALSRGENLLLVLLDGITDIRNFGAIARSVECLGAHGLLIGDEWSAPVNAEAIKISAGALTRLPICKEKNLVTAIKYLKANGIQIVCADWRAASPITTYDWKQPVVLVMGSEGRGVTGQVRKHCDASVQIPMQGATESLNVSVSTAIILYEAMRSRTQTQT